MVTTGTLIYLLCALFMVQDPATQTPRTYQIHDEQHLKTVLTEVVEVKGIRNLQSPNFPADFEVEVKNISQRPIYMIYIVAILPVSSARFGQPFGFSLSLGERMLGVDGHAKPEDVPLNPGETACLKVEDASGSGLRKYLENNLGPAGTEEMLRKVSLYFQIISFGDGTGYQVGDPYPTRRAPQ
ncbi:MAG TPA: hypothetical protein VJ302_22215 [Blastocatellia bacterium]|nr:hypothetical protein [Blastocatellia bacterium]